MSLRFVNCKLYILVHNVESKYNWLEHEMYKLYQILLDCNYLKVA